MSEKEKVESTEIFSQMEKDYWESKGQKSRESYEDYVDKRTPAEMDALIDEVRKEEYQDPEEVIFELKEIIVRDRDLISLGYSFEVIPLIHDTLEKVLPRDEFEALDNAWKDHHTACMHLEEQKALMKGFEWYWENVLQGITSLDKLRERIIERFPIEFEYVVEGPPLQSADIEYILHSKGIIKRKTKHLSKGAQIIDYPIWEWDKLRLLQVLKDEGASETHYRFNFMFNDDIFQDKSLEWMRDYIHTGHCKGLGKEKQIFGPLIIKYVKQGEVPVKNYSDICGFTPDGWRMPDSHFIKFTDLQAPIRSNLQHLVKMEVVESEAKIMMQDLYDAVSLKYKDILFAHLMIMPFLYAMRSYTDLLYWLAMGGPGNTGKTPAGIMITTKIWNNLPSSYITKDQANAESRFADYVSATTFGVAIDDMGDIEDKVLNTMKSYHTGDAHWTRKNVDNTIKINKPLTSPLIMLFNRIPGLFGDIPFLERGIYLPVDETPSRDQIDQFQTAYRSIPKGYLGKYIYDKLRFKTLSYFTDIYDMTENWVNPPVPRSNIIWRYLQTGAFLFKEIFDIKLDLSEVQTLILETLKMGSEDIFGVFQTQLSSGVARKQRNEITGEMEFIFEPKVGWLRSPVFFQITRKYNGYFYTWDALQDLNNRLKLKTPLDLPSFCDILRKHYPNAEYITAKIQKQAMKCVYIPYSDIEDKGIDTDMPEPPAGVFLNLVEMQVMEIIWDMQVRGGGSAISLEDFLDRVNALGLSRDTMQEALPDLVKKGVLHQTYTPDKIPHFYNMLGELGKK